MALTPIDTTTIPGGMEVTTATLSVGNDTLHVVVGRSLGDPNMPPSMAAAIQSSNVARVAADRGDANVTLVAGTDSVIQPFATTLTANRTVTLSTTGAVNGSRFQVVRSGLGAFTLAVGALKTIPSATAAMVEVMFNGAAWILTDYSPL